MGTKLGGSFPGVGPELGGDIPGWVQGCGVVFWGGSGDQLESCWFELV